MGCYVEAAWWNKLFIHPPPSYYIKLTPINSGLTNIVVPRGSVSTATTGQLGSSAWTCLSMAANFCLDKKGGHVVRNLYRDFRESESVCKEEQIVVLYVCVYKSATIQDPLTSFAKQWQNTPTITLWTCSINDPFKFFIMESIKYSSGSFHSCRTYR